MWLLPNDQDVPSRHVVNRSREVVLVRPVVIDAGVVDEYVEYSDFSLISRMSYAIHLWHELHDQRKARDGHGPFAGAST